MHPKSLGTHLLLDIHSPVSGAVHGLQCKLLLFDFEHKHVLLQFETEALSCIALEYRELLSRLFNYTDKTHVQHSVASVQTFPRACCCTCWVSPPPRSHDASTHPTHEKNIAHNITTKSQFTKQLQSNQLINQRIGQQCHATYTDKFDEFIVDVRATRQKEATAWT